MFYKSSFYKSSPCFTNPIQSSPLHVLQYAVQIIKPPSPPPTTTDTHTHPRTVGATFRLDHDQYTAFDKIKLMI